MRIIRSLNQMSGLSEKIKLSRKSLGFVPTMGALHEGHLSLMRSARKENDFVVVSIFVNPIQFGPKEDLKSYPRNIKQDALLCKKEGVDIIFCPKTEDMYPESFKTYIEIDDLTEILCGSFRRGHFKGVATVVFKLFNIVSPSVAYFGQKDFQQAAIIKKISEDLNIAVKIRVMPTVRDKDGLALSSRNAYLNKSERRDAPVLYQALALARNLIKQNNRNSAGIIRRMKSLISKKKLVLVQYISIVDTENLLPLRNIKNKALIVIAAYIGKTRLIDNILVKVKS
jgi:pantoate--beta-alanine ligase